MKARGAVAAGHRRTAEAAATVLTEGGNAFDAISAALCAACAAEPILASLGGGGYLLAMPAEGPARVYDFFVHTPVVRRPERELDFREIEVDFGSARQRFFIGQGSIAVPGVMRGLFRVHGDLGHMPMREVVAPAIEIARGGVTLDELQAYIFQVVGPIYTATADARAIFGSPADRERLIGEGETLLQPAFAEALEILAIEGADLFYRGEMGRAAVEQSLDGGGHLTMTDLERYHVQVRDPLVVPYRRCEVVTTPPPSSGGMLVALALRLMESVENFDRFAFGSPGHLETIVRTLEATDRARLEVNLDEASPEDAAGLVLDPALVERYGLEIRRRAAALRGTTHIGVIDAAGNVAALTLSNGEGCGDIVPGTGLMLNNMLGEEDLHPRGFNRWPCDQRMTSMMAPTCVRFPDGRVVATGSGGSKRIRSAILQVLVNLIDHGMGVQNAVESPRLYVENGFLNVEGGFREGSLARLLEAYPEHHLWDDINLFFGGANTVEARPDGFGGAGDPRRGGVSRVVA